MARRTTLGSVNKIKYRWQVAHPFVCPLMGDGLCEAEGECGNPLLRNVKVKTVEVSPETMVRYPTVLRTYEYDIDALPGKVYKVKRLHGVM